MWKFNTCSCFDLLMHNWQYEQNCHRNSSLHLAQFSHLTFECHFEHLEFLGIAFSFMKLISSSDTSTKRGKVVILKNCSSAIITSPGVIIAECDAILSQWERKNFYDPSLVCLSSARTKRRLVGKSRHTCDAVFTFFWKMFFLGFFCAMKMGLIIPWFY